MKYPLQLTFQLIALLVVGVVLVGQQQRIRVLEQGAERLHTQRATVLSAARAEGACATATRRLQSVETLLKELLGSKQTYQRMLNE